MIKQVADALEAAAGITTSTNENDTGYWLRIANAAEDLAGVSNTRNMTLGGFYDRTALALESLSGTDGVAENRQEDGYFKRIVDALEVLAGQVYTGSLEYRMVQAAQNVDAAPNNSITAFTVPVTYLGTPVTYTPGA